MRMNTSERVSHCDCIFTFFFQAFVLVYDVGNQASFEAVDHDIGVIKWVGLNMILVLLHKGILSGPDRTIHFGDIRP